MLHHGFKSLLLLGQLELKLVHNLELDAGLGHRLVVDGVRYGNVTAEVGDRGIATWNGTL